MSIIRFPMVVLLATLATGCATLLDSPIEPLHIQTSPPGASVTINGYDLPGVTPMWVEVDARAPVRLELRLGGHEPVVAWIENDVEVGWVLLDLITLPFPLPGLNLIVDLLTGAWFDLETNWIHVNMPPSGSAPATGGDPVPTPVIPPPPVPDDYVPPGELPPKRARAN